MTPPTTLHFLSDGCEATLIPGTAPIKVKDNLFYLYKYTKARENEGKEFVMGLNQIRMLVETKLMRIT